jgi:CubicO group peptidase (beta-lactamase class C family)
MAVPDGTDADGSDERNITNLPTSDDTDPQWSPDGSQIAFASTRNGREDIYVMDADGSNVRRLTHHSAVDADPTWSPDGTRIAFVSLRDGNVEVYVIDADGSNLQRLTHNTYNDFEIDWSPDGTYIAVASQKGMYGNIYLIDVEAALQDPAGHRPQQLTDTDAHDAFPAWSPDGSRIAFTSDREGQSNWEIYVMDADGSNQERLTYTDAIDGLPSWSPDGTQIVFESDREGDFEIYVMAADGTDVRPLTENSVHDRNPDWRPSTTPPSSAGTSCECASLDPLQTQLVYDVGPGDDAESLSFATPEEEGMDGDVLEAGVAALAEFSNMYSVLILRNDRIVLERYFQNEAPRHARNIQSASKSLLSALVGIAIREGYIQSVDQTAAEFLPAHFASVQDPRKLDITLRHLLTMTPGFSYQDNLYDLPGDWLAAAISYPLVSEPGSAFRYSTLSSHILSAVLTEATGMSTCEFACHYLFQPLGITIDNWSRDPQGYYMGGVAMYFTPRELARFGLLFLHDGVWDGHPVVPGEWIAESMTHHVSETGFPGVSYGYAWWLESARGYEVHAAVGHGGQTIRIVPDLNLVVVTTADSYAPAQGIETFPLLEEYVIPAIQDENS